MFFSAPPYNDVAIRAQWVYVTFSLYNSRMRPFHALCLSLLLLTTGCGTQPQAVSAIGIPSPTPFQPAGTNASDALYADSAPTPVALPTVTPLPPPTLEPTATPTEFVAPVPINPLTGLPFSDAALEQRRPVAIKVANFPRYVRPQSGLTLADQVFEYYIEAGLSRFVAVFYGNNSEWVGPVRSGRFFDENIQRMYQSFIVFKYADKRVLEYFRTTDFADFLVVPTLRSTEYGPCPPFELLPEREANVEVYNNSYFRMNLWQPCIDKYDLPSDAPSFRRDLFNADYTPGAGSVPGTFIRTYYSTYDYHYWQYDPASGEYLRFQETGDIRNGREEKYAPLIDRVTNQQVHAANVVVILTYHTFYNPFQEEDEVYHMDLSGSGEAYVFRDGTGIVARWTRAYVNQPLSLTDATGLPIPLKPGITFYQVIGANSYADQGDGEWNFHHETP